MNGEITISAGIAVICDYKRILLVHPTGYPWKSNMGLPKGHVEEGEAYIDAAIRETYEETGIVVPKKRISNPESPFSVLYKDSEGNVFKKVYVYTCPIKNPSDLGLDGWEIPFDNIPMPEEVDHAHFYLKGEAEALIHWRYRAFLLFLRK